jgi:hypothetical protein
MKVMKQTAVEWFSNESWKLKIQLENKEINMGEYAVAYVKLLDESKEMEKNQIMNAYNEGHYHSFNPAQYYNKTFNTK